MLEWPLLSVLPQVFLLGQAFACPWDLLLGALIVGSPHFWNGVGNLEALLKGTKRQDSL